MKDQPDPSQELDRLYQVEYRNPHEVFLRLCGVIVAGGLLFGYTGWISAILWSALFMIAQATYFLFLKMRMTRAVARDVTIAEGLFLLLLVSFLWMPALMISENDRALSICGAALIGCILVFLVRRTDSSRLMVYGEVVVVAITILATFLRLIPQFTDPFAKVGLIGAGLALLYYFAEAATAARKLRIEAADANRRSMQAEKMAAVGRLAGGVAHDFNNNLTAILGHLELLALIDDPIERRISIEGATLAAEQGARTVKQLLSFARKDRLTMAPQDGAEILDGLVALTRRLIPASVALRVELGPERQQFMADRGQLLSALINLVVNAVDAMPSGGSVTLSSTVIRLTSPFDLADGSRLAAGAYVRISVEDQGSGIPAEILPKVLEPFFTTKPVGKGTGLGLPMAFGVSRELGGGLTIATSPAGTTVSIFLPRID